MREKLSPQSGVERLLAQDAALESFPFEESRMRLDASIRRLEQRARAVNRASLCGLGVFIAFVLATMPLQALGAFEPQWARMLWSGCGLAAMLITGVLTAIYSYRYRPALERAKGELLATTIAQLQQQVAELGRKVDGQRA